MRRKRHRASASGCWPFRPARCFSQAGRTAPGPSGSDGSSGTQRWTTAAAPHIASPPGSRTMWPHVRRRARSGAVNIVMWSARRGLAHQIARRDVQCRGELADGVHARLTAGLEASDGGAVNAGLLGELQLNETALHAPVQEGWSRGQGGSRHSSLDGSRVRRQSDSVATPARRGRAGRACWNGWVHASSVRCEYVACMLLTCSMRAARPAPVLLNSGGHWSCRRPS